MQTMQTIGAAGAYQTVGAPITTTMAAPQMTYGAAGAYQTVGAPITTTMAAPQMTYGAPMIQSIAAPAVEYIQAAPAVEYIQAAPQVVQAGPRNLLAMGNVISERVITIEELEANDRYGAAEAVMVAAPVLEVDRVNAFGQVVERDFVGAAPMTTTIAAPAQYVTAAPQMTYGAPIMSTMAAPAVEIDTVNAFGQVVERDLVGAAPVTYAAAPQVTYAAAPQMTYGAPISTVI